jgi:hypothetical protein
VTTGVIELPAHLTLCKADCACAKHHERFSYVVQAHLPMLQSFTNIFPKGIIRESVGAAYALPGVFVRLLVS